MRIHITAVAGTGMGSLAGLLQELGHEVSGSDVAFYPPMGPALREWGIRLMAGFEPAHLNPPAHDGHALDAVVVGNVCREDNPQAVAALELGIERLHLASALDRFALPGTSPLVVAGTHGKTTTSSLCAHLLDQAGLEPGFLIGGVPCSLGRGFRAAGKRKLQKAGEGKGQRATPFVLEGDEYDTAFWEKTAKFLHYHAEVAVLTSIEHDHIDIYPTFEQYLEAFERFVQGLPKDGLLVAYAGDENVVRIAKQASCPVVYYAKEGDPLNDVSPHWLAAPAGVTPEGTEFDLFAGGVLAGRFVSPMSGDHNLRNAVAAIAATAQGYGVDIRSLAEPLASFGGVKRRQELVGTPGKVSVYDDFAHHPTAVRETLTGLRTRHPNKKLIAVFEPRSATACGKLHQKDYVSAFDAADYVVFAPIGRDVPADEKLDVQQLAIDVTTRGSSRASRTPRAEALPNVDAIVARVSELAVPGDGVAVLSNGAFGGIHGKLLKALDDQ